MKNWLKKNWFKVGVLLLALVIVLVFASKKSDENILKRQEDDYLTQKIECNKVGQNFHKNFSETETITLDPEYGFSRKLNTCVYIGGWASPLKNDFLFELFIKDVYTNKTVVSYSNFDNLAFLEARNKIDAKKAELLLID